MQAIPECRKRVWKKEWQQIVGSQTSFLTGTKRTANRHKKWREKKGGDQYGKREMVGWMEGRTEAEKQRCVNVQENEENKEKR